MLTKTYSMASLFKNAEKLIYLEMTDSRREETNKMNKEESSVIGIHVC